MVAFLGYAANKSLYLQVKDELKEEDKGEGIHKGEPKESSEEK